MATMAAMMELLGVIPTRVGRPGHNHSRAGGVVPAASTLPRRPAAGRRNAGRRGMGCLDSGPRSREPHPAHREGGRQMEAGWPTPSSTSEVFWKPADGAGRGERLFQSDERAFAGGGPRTVRFLLSKAGAMSVSGMRTVASPFSRRHPSARRPHRSCPMASSWRTFRTSRDKMRSTSGASTDLRASGPSQPVAGRNPSGLRTGRRCSTGGPTRCGRSAHYRTDLRGRDTGASVRSPLRTQA